jgi:hypothetical protein
MCPLKKPMFGGRPPFRLDQQNALDCHRAYDTSTICRARQTQSFRCSLAVCSTAHSSSGQGPRCSAFRSHFFAAPSGHREGLCRPLLNPGPRWLVFVRHLEPHSSCPIGLLQGLRQLDVEKRRCDANPSEMGKCCSSGSVGTRRDPKCAHLDSREIRLTA